jgi:3-hydroxyacyl-CoA dehydrogenase
MGLDTALRVAEHLKESYGDRLFVPKQMRKLVAAGNLGAKTGKGFCEHGN